MRPKASRFVGTVALILFPTVLFSQSLRFQFPFLYRAWEENRLCTVPLQQLRHRDVADYLQTLRREGKGLLSVEEVGRSVENRPIFLVKMGGGPVKILLWSQMHGDEPTATAALLDVFYFLENQAESDFVRPILQNTTVLAVPMLNPDGAERFTRRNALGIDINRDARDLQTPEGRVLRGLQQRFRPQFGFNLHDQNGRRTVGKTNRLVAIALMAPPFDWEENDNPVRIRAKKIVSVIYQALSSYIYGHMAKYDAEYMPRAFGDSMQSWGVSTVLIESGGWFENRDDFLQRMNFIALLTVFHAIATGDYQEANPGLYEAIPRNDRVLYDLLIQDVQVIDGLGHPPYKADVAVNFGPRSLLPEERTGTIADIGDLDIFAAKDTIDGRGLFLAPGVVAVEQAVPPSPEALEKRLKEHLIRGETTVLFPEPVPEALLSGANLWANVGAFYPLSRLPGTARDSLSILLARQSGVQAAVWRGGTPPGSSVLGMHLFGAGALPAPLRWPSEAVPEVFTQTARLAEAFGLGPRGRVRVGQTADLVLLRKFREGFRPVRVLLRGYTVWREGKGVAGRPRGQRLAPRKE